MIQPTNKDIGRVVTLRVYDRDATGQTVRAEIIAFDRMGVDVLIEGEAIAKRKNRVDLSWLT